MFSFLEKKVSEILLRIIDFDANNLNEETIKSISDSVKYQEKDTVTWLNIDGLHNTEIMETIATEFNFDRLCDSLCSMLNSALLGQKIRWNSRLRCSSWLVWGLGTLAGLQVVFEADACQGSTLASASPSS